MGVPRNTDKDECGQIVTVLGYELDSLFEMRIPLPKDEYIRNIVQTLLLRKTTPLHDVQVAAGYLAWAAPAVQLGWVFCRELWNFENKFDAKNTFQQIRIPEIVREDLRWWRDCFTTFNSIRFFDDPARIHFHLLTDACGEGVGGFFYKNSFSEPIPPEETTQPLDINISSKSKQSYGQFSSGATFGLTINCLSIPITRLPQQESRMARSRALQILTSGS